MSGKDEINTHSEEWLYNIARYLVYCPLQGNLKFDSDALFEIVMVFQQSFFDENFNSDNIELSKVLSQDNTYLCSVTRVTIDEFIQSIGGFPVSNYCSYSLISLSNILPYLPFGETKLIMRHFKCKVTKINPLDHI